MEANAFIYLLKLFINFTFSAKKNLRKSNQILKWKQMNFIDDLFFVEYFDCVELFALGWFVSG